MAMRAEGLTVIPTQRSIRESGGNVWITGDVNLPAELLEAHADGLLVLFVGAGASMGDPSNLPSFRELARQLADAARVPFDEDMALDLFLGSMPEDFETHAQARRIIERPDSTFNSTHTALVRLASALGRPRIVTTNFDNHLTTASATSLLPEGDFWVGPALPLGDDFSGIVHLHGSVLRPPAQLVLTDRDFGRAYLTDAWATRFLQKMFDEFTVLFVGYSHDDPIMRYLALGLPSKTRRYVLTHVPDDGKWSHLGIVPVPYPVVEHDHSALLDALEEWDRRARMGRLDHQTRTKEIVDAGPPLNAVDEDYMRERLQRVEGAREFVQYARSVDWLRWAESAESFHRLFIGGPDLEVSSVLGHWFGQVYVADPALHGAALQSVQRLGQRFSPGLYQSLSWATESLTAADAEAGRRWTAVLATSIGGISAPPDVGMLLPYEPRARSEELALLRPALRPFLVLKPRWALGRDNPLALPHAEATWHAADEVLTRHVLKLVEDRPAGDPALGTLLEDALGSAYELLTGYHGEDSYDGLSSRRSGIEPHLQDGFRDPIDALIDGLRDYGEKALSERPELPERWWTRGSALFRRLALHLLELSSTVFTDEKLEWVLDRDVLFESPLKHEVFRLVASTLPEASPDRRSQLLVAAIKGPNLPDDLPDVERHRAYSVYNLLVWLTHSDPAWAEAQRARERLEEENPTFGPRDFPDLDSWSSGVTWGETPPIEIESFVQDLGSDAEAALTTLLNVDYSEQRVDGPTWNSALTLVQQAATRRPDLGQQLWNAIESRSTLADKKNDLQDAIIGGWEQADLGELLDDIVALVASRVGERRSTRAITRLLVTQIEKHLETPESEPITAMRNLARAIWDEHKGTFESPPDSEPSFLALNSWPGDLARYWILEVNRRWRELGETWTGLNDRERKAFEALLSIPGAELDAIRPALAGQAYFLFAADPSFAQQHVLPLFDGPHAAQAWGAYLYNPRYNDRMLSAGFVASVIAEWDHLGDLGERGLQSQFYGLVASIVNVAGITPEQRQELLDRSVLADNGDHAAEFASTVLRFFRDDAIDGASSWELWARDHLAARLLGLPRNARSEELERWADLAPFVGAHAVDAFSLLSGLG
ncbi:MAG: SIR2 family protein, partial [Thermomicrobiales bacterium]